MTLGQQKAYSDLWPRYGIDIEPDTQLSSEALFNNQHPLLLEIGFGNGESLLSVAKQNPGNNYIGIEVHRPGVGHLLGKASEAKLNNLRVIRHDAMEILANHLPPQNLDGIMLFFPDPWHKRKHHKRRIVQPRFVDLCADAMRVGGILHMATDWKEYADHMMKTLSSQPKFHNLSGTGHYTPRPQGRPLTKFEQRGQRLGHGVWDLVFVRR